MLCRQASGALHQQPCQRRPASAALPQRCLPPPRHGSHTGGANAQAISSAWAQALTQVGGRVGGACIWVEARPPRPPACSQSAAHHRLLLTAPPPRPLPARTAAGHLPELAELCPGHRRGLCLVSEGLVGRGGECAPPTRPPPAHPPTHPTPPLILPQRPGRRWFCFRPSLCHRHCPRQRRQPGEAAGRVQRRCWLAHAGHLHWGKRPPWCLRLAAIRRPPPGTAPPAPPSLHPQCCEAAAQAFASAAASASAGGTGFAQAVAEVRPLVGRAPPSCRCFPSAAAAACLLAGWLACSRQCPCADDRLSRPGRLASSPPPAPAGRGPGWHHHPHLRVCGAPAGHGEWGPSALCAWGLPLALAPARPRPPLLRTNPLPAAPPLHAGPGLRRGSGQGCGRARRQLWSGGWVGGWAGRRLQVKVKQGWAAGPRAGRWRCAYRPMASRGLPHSMHPAARPLPYRLPAAGPEPGHCQRGRQRFQPGRRPGGWLQGRLCGWGGPRHYHSTRS